MTPLDSIRSLSATTAVVIAAVVVGDALRRRLRIDDEDRGANLVWNAGLGFVAWGVLLTVLGLCHVLYQVAIIGLTSAAVVVAIVGVYRRRQAIAVQSFAPPSGAAVAVVVGAVALSSLLSALAPPTAGDALVYHLELPKRFLEAHGLVHLPYSDNSTYPLLAEMWFAWGLALDGPVAAQLIHWLCGMLTAGGAYVVALPLVGRRSAWIAFTLVLLTPGVNNQMTAPLNDVALAAMTTLAVAATLRGFATMSGRSFVATGIFLGAALGIKYTALIFAVSAALPLTFIVLSRQAVRPFVVRGICLASIATAVVAGPWYLRSYHYRGDPLYPFLTAERETANAAGPSKFPDSKAPLGRTPAAWLVAPWSMTMQPQQFGGRGHQLGPFWLMLLPLVPLLTKEQRTRLLPLAAICVVFGCACLMLRQNVRFLLPVAPLAAVTVAAVLRRLSFFPAIPRGAAFATCGIVGVLLMAIPAVRARHGIGVACGLESRESYLRRMEPSFAPAAWANANLPADSRLLTQEQRSYWFEAAVTRENIYRRRHNYVAQAAASPGTLSSTLRAAGFTHLLLAEAADSRTPPYDATLSDAFAREARAAPTTLVVLADLRTDTPQLGSRRYRIVELR